MLELAGEVQDVLGRSYGLPEDVDEDDLEAGELLFTACNIIRNLNTAYIGVKGFQCLPPKE